MELVLVILFVIHLPQLLRGTQWSLPVFTYIGSRRVGFWIDGLAIVTLGFGRVTIQTRVLKTLRGMKSFVPIDPLLYATF